MLWVVQISAHSACTASQGHADRNCRNPRACLICPNTGSTICFRESVPKVAITGAASASAAFSASSRRRLRAWSRPAAWLARSRHMHGSFGSRAPTDWPRCDSPRPPKSPPELMRPRLARTASTRGTSCGQSLMLCVSPCATMICAWPRRLAAWSRVVAPWMKPLSLVRSTRHVGIGCAGALHLGIGLF